MTSLGSHSDLPIQDLNYLFLTFLFIYLGKLSLGLQHTVSLVTACELLVAACGIHLSMQETQRTQVPSLGREDPLEQEMTRLSMHAIHPSIELTP